MKQKTRRKLLLDLIMTVLYILLMFGYAVGALFHEAVGLGILLLFALHLFWNRKLLLGLMRAGVRGILPRLKAVQLTADVMLILGMPVTVLTGVMISKVLFETHFLESVRMVHNFSAYTCLAAMLLHLVLHAGTLIVLSRQWSRKAGSIGIVRLAERAAAFCAAVCLLYAALSATLNKNNNTVSISDAGTATEAVLSSEKTEKKEEEASASASVSGSADAPSLSEFLGKLYCTGCHRHCSLLDPECMRGQSQVRQAESDYTEQYIVTQE